MVALVRDDEDTELAEASGIRRWLRKPFDRDELEHLLARLGRLAGDPA
jgi:CheY-like chemotaxis protein